MPLTLRLDAPDPDAVERMPEQRVFDAEDAITIGRGDNSGIVLVDRLRSISKNHCEIRRSGGVYEVLDHSRNGTFLNERLEALPREVGVPLRAGDALRIGCFTVAVLRAEVAAGGDGWRDGEPGSLRAPGAGAGGDGGGSGGLRDGSLGGGSQHGGSLHGGSLGERGAGGGLAGRGVGADLPAAGSRGSDLRDGYAAGGYGAGAGQAGFGNGGMGPGAPWDAGDRRRDAALPEFRPAPPDGPPPPRLPEPSLPPPGAAAPLSEARHAALSEPWRDGAEDDSLFGAQSLPAAGPGVRDAEGPLLGAAFQRPRQAREAIPEEWDIAAELGLPRPQRPSGADDAFPAPPSRAGMDGPEARPDLSGRDMPGPGVDHPGLSVSGTDGSGLGGSRVGGSGTGVPVEGPPRTAAAGPQADGMREVGASIPPHRDGPNGGADDQAKRGDAEAERALEAFLRGCGVSRAELGALPLEVAMNRAGVALRYAMSGLHDMLGARSSYKQSFGVELTLVGKSRNNPLKFIEDGGDAVRAVMVTDMPGFLSGGEMVEEALHDIKRHQLAMITAMRAGLADLCRQLAPETIERSAGRPPRALRWMRPVDQARCWERYLTVYDEITASLDNDALRVFGDGFARAYASAGAGDGGNPGEERRAEDRDADGRGAGAGELRATPARNGAPLAGMRGDPADTPSHGPRNGTVRPGNGGTSRTDGMPHAGNADEFRAEGGDLFRAGSGNTSRAESGDASRRADNDLPRPWGPDAQRVGTSDPSHGGNENTPRGEADRPSQTGFGASLREDVGDVLRDRVRDFVRDGVDDVLRGGIGGMFRGGDDDARGGHGTGRRGDGGDGSRAGNGDGAGSGDAVRRGREGGHV